MENYLPNTSEPLKLLTAREATRSLRVNICTLNRIEQCGALYLLRIPGSHRRYTVDILNGCLERGDIEVEVQKLENA